MQPGLPAKSRSSSAKILQFFEDLTDVGELLGRDTGAYPGYIDRSMFGGQRWQDEVCEALGTCQVFIPLISPSLAGSDWCGKEWHAFSSRKFEPRGVRLSDHQTAILPVIWAPFDMSAMPEVISDIQMFSPTRLPSFEIAENYQEEGVLGLLNLGWEQKYRSVVWRLAQQVVAVSRSYHVKPSKPDPAKLRNVFKEPVP